MNYNTLFDQMYDAFNKRDADAVLSFMHDNVHWPNGWEGGYINGKEEVRDYWTRQWNAINPKVYPVETVERSDKQIAVKVHQLVKDLNDQVIGDDMIVHIYHFEDGLITQMDIQK